MAFFRRNRGIIHRKIDDGLLAIDSGTNQAHALSAVGSAVWEACEEPTTAADVASATGLAETEVEAAVEDLADAGLVVYERPSVRRITRRAVIAGGAGGTAALLASIALPTAAMADSTGTSGAGGSTSAGGSSGQGGGSGGSGTSGSGQSDPGAAGASGPTPTAVDTAAATGSTPNGGSLAVTGAPLSQEATVGGSLIAAGAVVVAATNRKKRPAPEIPSA